MAKIRNWREKFDPTKPMAWRVARLYDARMTVIGELLPTGVPPQKLRALWKARWIELAKPDAKPAPVEEARRGVPGPAGRRDRPRARAAS